MIESGESAPNGTYTLYVEGDSQKPWNAYCHQMNLVTPLEYLTVVENDNFSSISDGTSITLTNFRRYRIDPVSLQIDLLNDEFATTDENTPVVPDGRAHIPAGWAQFSSPSNGDGPAASSQINFESTGFAFAESVLLGNFFCTTDTGGDSSGSDVTVAVDLTSVLLSAINSNATELTKTVADCDNLSPADQPGTTEYVTATIPLQYIGN